MRIVSLTLLLALLAPAARAQEDATAQLPKDTPVALRVASFDRIDALAKEWVPILKSLGLGAQVAPLEQMPASNLLFMATGFSGEMVDRTKPIYVGLVGEKHPVLVLHPAAGAAWEGKKELRQGFVAILRGGAIVAGENEEVDGETRGTPTNFRVEGDAVVHVYLSDLIAQHKEEIESDAADVAMGIAAQGAVPEEARALILPVVTAVKDGVLSLESLDYGLTWSEGRLESEGLLAIQEGSGFSKLLKRAGTPGQAELAAYLPKDAYVTATANTNADWPTKELMEMLKAAGGEEVGKALMQLMSFSSICDVARTGRTATSVNMGMMMSASILTLAELKPGTDTAALLAAIDIDKTNAAMKKIGLPFAYQFEKNFAKHKIVHEGKDPREVDLHRFSITSDDPGMAMFLASMQGVLALDNGFLVIAMSPTAQDDIGALLDKIDNGEKDMEHPHVKAMARLGRGHNFGFTINLGALKPMAAMAQMFGAPPQFGQAMQSVPDIFPLSTAVTFDSGNIRWRGDWPVAEAVKIAQAVMGPPKKAEPSPTEPKPEDEGDTKEFD
jgi:hypothetical protein